ncbi:hypothetical protein COLO4_38355 [Corchorus olitorius]|uniref:Uncharacterized protein n=1 Tax=Corchorus olitorius TaxID=93759 RepID=A0A1R3FVF1_9ROSI|nr:hypothetical protein COLO4_38355 [Corchorus olitorius]
MAQSSSPLPCHFCRHLKNSRTLFCPFTFLLYSSLFLFPALYNPPFLITPSAAARPGHPIANRLLAGAHQNPTAGDSRPLMPPTSQTRIRGLEFWSLAAVPHQAGKDESGGYQAPKVLDQTPTRNEADEGSKATEEDPDELIETTMVSFTLPVVAATDTGLMVKLFRSSWQILLLLKKTPFRPWVRKD